MARRRYQNPKPERRGRWWTLRFWQNADVNGKRMQKRVRLAPVTMPAREVEKIAAEMLRPMNQGFGSVGSATTFQEYMETTYNPTVLPLLAKTTQSCYEGVIGKHLEPTFGASCLRDLTPLTLQRHFSGLHGKVQHPLIVKLRTALSSVLRSAVQFGFLVNNPLDGLRLPPDRKGGRRRKPFITPDEFDQLVNLISEPYATMVYTAVWTGLRVSELCGLKWRCIHTAAKAITIEERYFRGDWAAPKTTASAATIGVEPEVIERIQRLKTLTVDVRAGRAVRHYKAVKMDGPDDLVFQSVKEGRPMNDQNVLKRYIKPAALRLGLLGVGWRCLRRSHATWLIQAGADAKSVQAQMRHARIATTMDIYAQIVPEAQRQALQKLSQFAKREICDQAVTNCDQSNPPRARVSC